MLAFQYVGYLSEFRIEFDRPAPVVVSGLSGAWDLNVRTETAAAEALAIIDPMIEHAVAAASYYGSVGRRISLHETLNAQLKDVLVSGRGGLTDADMEDVAAKLVASQVRRDLALVSLSVANGRPEVLLSLFR
ncbi:hypothetical protein [Rubrimonas cliftonensis]|uniref:Flagellin n=1 Tax=Rubrimonas cliftonensis TaxID=89524 RepID=A0A1H4EV36_9RHOB|nr:hypothetical protein [Rubrimonas cliftonensis]SEA88796.1 flagellin [Rubrimonas cliftonensis]